MHTDVSGPDMALTVVQLPHGLTHKPARSECIDCSITKRILARELKGVSSSVAKPYGDLLTMDHSRITEGYGFVAVGGSQHLRCVNDRATQCCVVAPTKSIDGDAVACHMLHAVGEDTIRMVYSEWCLAQQELAILWA